MLFIYFRQKSPICSLNKKKIKKSAAICDQAAAPTAATGPQGSSLKINAKLCLRWVTETSFLIPNNSQSPAAAELLV